MTDTTAKMSAIGWAAILALPIVIGTAYCLRLLSGPDPADHFEVLRVVTDSNTQRHAVVYRYNHSNSSTKPIAVWIVLGKAPSVGSNDPARGAPALVWPGPVATLTLKWPPADGRLVAEIDHAPDVAKSEHFNDCYFDYDRKTAVVCADPKQVEVRTGAVDS
jgi:hypothetical protein